MTETHSDTRVGFIGLGVMGKSMARNLLKAGFALTVFNRSPAKMDELVSEGANGAQSPGDVASNASIIFLCLPDTPDVERVLFGDDGVANSVSAGTTVIDCSTISATATQDFASRLKEKGVDMIDCPVSGGPAGAENGTLSCMLGGSAEAIERVKPMLNAIGEKFVHAGPSGSGQLVKSCNQLVICATMMGVGEAVALCKRMGVDPLAMREALLGGSAQSFVLENHGKRLIDQTLDPGFRAELMLKDMKLALGTGRDAGVFIPATALATQMLTALCQTGRNGLDSAAVGLLFQELSGVE